MTDCPDESRTLHFLGSWYGFGPVQNNESIILAVFDSSARDGDSLTALSFTTSSLKKGEESVVRAALITKADFTGSVVEPGVHAKGSFIGIATADVGQVRSIRVDVEAPSVVKRNVRAVCVLDRVDLGDFDAHATLGYASHIEPEGIREKQLGKVRQRIRMDLANTFSKVVHCDSHRWSTRMYVLTQRAVSVARVIFGRHRE